MYEDVIGDRSYHQLLEEVVKLKPQKNTGLNRIRTHGLCDTAAVLYPPGGGGGVLPIMAYTGRLRPKGVPFSGFRYIIG